MQNKADPTEKIATQKPESKREWKTNLRQQYFLERELIRHEIGDLTQIQQKLGLSQRRLCKLLLVDPSAWTRWLKKGAPPHIYQALRWLVKLQETHPQIVGQGDLADRMDLIQSDTQTKIRALEEQVSQLERELAQKNSASDLELAQFALRAQEQRFAAELSRLEEKFKGLTLVADVAPPPAVVRRPKRRAAPRKKSRRRLKSPVPAKRLRTTKRSTKKLRARSMRGRSRR